MPFRSFVFLFSFLVFSSAAHAQSFDGKYEGKLILTKGEDCGEKSEAFVLEVKGNKIRILSPRAPKPLEGEIRPDGQLAASGPGRGNVTLEWRAQILATKTGLGTLLQKGSGLCQFLLSLKRT
jgi:hypothetical protein